MKPTLLLVVAALTTQLAACSGDALRGDGAEDTSDSSNGTVDASGVNRTRVAQDATIALLSRSAGGAEGQDYRDADDNESLQSISGKISAPAGIPTDTMITPTHDLQACKPFRDVIMPRKGDGVGNAIVWLVGVDRGRANALPLRTTLRLNDCHLEPRVHRIAVGGTVIVNSRDAMESRIRVIDATGDPSAPRALLTFNDFGQVVPDDKIAMRAGLVEVRDDKHPWVRAYIAVSPHPFVEVTDADGNYTFDGVAPGEYQLVVFSERLGLRKEQVTVAATPVKVDVRF